MLKRSQQRTSESEPRDDALMALLSGYSIEVLPRTAARIEDFRTLLPAGTRVYIAHVEGVPIDEMVATARRLRREGFEVMPHIPARAIADVAMLRTWLDRYRQQADVSEALLIAGGNTRPHGEFANSIEMMQAGLFERYGFRRLHVAGHPEVNTDIDPDGTTTQADRALAWKQAFAIRTGIRMAIVTQFAFDVAPLIGWSQRIAGNAIELPIHAGFAGPAKLHTLIRYALACGVGPSLQILQRRAADISHLMVPQQPGELLSALAAWRALHPQSAIQKVHLFPLGGVRASAEWANAHAAPRASLASGRPGHP